MEIYKKVTNYFYRIETKPAGGFVGIPSDASMGTIEGATREEVMRKIEERIGAAVGAEFPWIKKLLHADPNVINIEAKPGGGFVARLPGSATETIEGTTQEEVLKKIEESLSASFENPGPIGQTVVHKDFQIGGLHFSIDKELKAVSRNSSETAQSAPTQGTWSQPSFSQTRFSPTSDSASRVDPTGPILPSKDTSGLIWRIIAVLIALGALIYFFLRR